MLSAYCEFHNKEDDNVVKLDDSQYDEIKIWEETNYWETGFNFKIVNNKSPNYMVLCHSNLDFKNGFIITPSDKN